MSETNIQGQVLHGGEAIGPLLLLDEPLSFWGGFDPLTGTILDSHHPQAGETVGGKILALYETRGSAGTPAAIAEAIRRGCGPLAFVLVKSDVNIVTGVSVAAHLYQIIIPVITIAENAFHQLRSGQKIEISSDGNITIR